MQCYTVGTVETTSCLSALQRGEDWIVKVGFNPAAELPVPPRRREGINRFVGALRQRAGGTTRFISILDEDGVVSPEEAQEALDEIEAGGLSICDLDWVDGKLVDARRASAALLNVVVCVNKEEGGLQYFANSFDEKVKDGRTIKVNRAFDQAEGVEVCAQGIGFFGETQALIRMLPGSSFRLRQNHPMTNGWEELVLRWNGRHLKWKEFFPRQQRPRAS